METNEERKEALIYARKVLREKFERIIYKLNYDSTHLEMTGEYVYYKTTEKCLEAQRVAHLLVIAIGIICGELEEMEEKQNDT